LEQLGPLVRARIPAIADVLSALKAFVESGDDANRSRAARHVGQLQADLADRENAVAAFDDLLDIAQDSTASHIAVKARLDVLTGVLELGDRSAAEVCRVLEGIVDDQALEISEARHELYNSPVRELNGSTNQQG
jgi:hypothetical protein